MAWALKEWASVVDALGAGRQTLLLRKGGIHEPAFRLEARQFALWPTYLHQRPELLTIEVGSLEPPPLPLRLQWTADVRGAWTVDHPDALGRLHGLHVWSDAYAHERLRWRPTQSLTVLAVRVRALASPLFAPDDGRADGCRSWVPLDEPLPEWAEPVVTDGVFSHWLELVRSELGPETVW